MNTVVLWLLITPLFFALGWIAGRIDMKTVIKQAKQLPSRLFLSIDELVDSKTALASDNIKQIVDQEPQLIELQISLGKIYRHRGENDLAIKQHTKLLNSKFIIDKNDREKVRLELAKDFHRAGLVDRAESILQALLESELYSTIAQELLLNIYQQDKNWEEAIKISKKLSTKDYTYHIEVAQFNCELAMEAIIKSQFEETFNHIQNAIAINRKCVRASIILGDLYYTQEKYEDAINAWQLIEKQNHLYLPMIIEKIFDAYNKLNKIKEGITLAKGYISIYPQLDFSDFIFQVLRNYISINETLELLRIVFINHPQAKIAAKIIEIQVSSNVNQMKIEAKSDAQLINNLLNKYNDKLAHYRCNRCNFKTKTFFWQCPSCYDWESISPTNNEI